MDLDDVLKKRRSIRNYDNKKKVSLNDVAEIIYAGTLAPSAGNLQSWNFIIVQDEEMKQKLVEASLNESWMLSAPVFIVVCARTKMPKLHYGKRGEMLYVIQDCAACVENMLLKATELKISSCWVGAFEENTINNLLSLPPDVRPQAIITLGYSHEEKEMPKRYHLDFLTYFEEYGQKKPGFFPLNKGSDKHHMLKEKKEPKLIKYLREKLKRK